MTNTSDISIKFQDTPRLWLATRADCWCEDCRGKNEYGLGKTPIEALAHLIELELDLEAV